MSMGQKGARKEGTFERKMDRARGRRPPHDYTCAARGWSVSTGVPLPELTPPACARCGAPFPEGTPEGSICEACAELSVEENMATMQGEVADLTQAPPAAVEHKPEAIGDY